MLGCPWGVWRGLVAGCAEDFFLEVGDTGVEFGVLVESVGTSAIEGFSVAVRMTKMGYRFHTQDSAMIPNRARVVAGTSTIGRGASR